MLFRTSVRVLLPLTSRNSSTTLKHRQCGLKINGQISLDVYKSFMTYELNTLSASVLIIILAHYANTMHHPPSHQHPFLYSIMDAHKTKQQKCLQMTCDFTSFARLVWKTPQPNSSGSARCLRVCFNVYMCRSINYCIKLRLQLRSEHRCWSCGFSGQ